SDIFRLSATGDLAAQYPAEFRNDLGKSAVFAPGQQIVPGLVSNCVQMIDEHLAAVEGIRVDFSIGWSRTGADHVDMLSWPQPRTLDHGCHAGSQRADDLAARDDVFGCVRVGDSRHGAIIPDFLQLGMKPLHGLPRSAP